jgi:hypothetical protein
VGWGIHRSEMPIPWGNCYQRDSIADFTLITWLQEGLAGFSTAKRASPCHTHHYHHPSPSTCSVEGEAKPLLQERGATGLCSPQPLIPSVIYSPRYGRLGIYFRLFYDPALCCLYCCSNTHLSLGFYFHWWNLVCGAGAPAGK